MTKNIKIKNCNNINAGDIVIEENKLNIKYGMNGTGKSTLSKAILKSSNCEPLDELKPFGVDENIVPICEGGDSFKTISVFDENFVNNVVFKESEVIDNAFEIFIKTPDYIKKREVLDDKLATLRIKFKQDIEITGLISNLNSFADKLALNKDETIKSTTSYKAIVKKNGIYNIPNEFKKYSPIINDQDICIDWIDWKTKGDKFDKKEICPYCSKDLDKDFHERQNKFKDVYKKTDAQNLKNILELFEKIHEYIDDDKFKEIIACIKENKDEKVIDTMMKSFIIEYNYIIDRLNEISSFDGVAFNNVDVNSLNKKLEGMKIEKTACNYFSSNKFNLIQKKINGAVDELINEISGIKEAIGKLKDLLNKTVKSSKNDINDFLKSAGMKYQIEMKVDEEGQATTILKYLNKESLTDVNEIRKHLSWGERNALSLILFMYQATSMEAELIILDDPISSFDDNKKYAILHRMFSKQKGNSKSLYEKTVLMLTHDFEPIIDFCVVKDFDKKELDIKFIQNTDGILSEKNIEWKNDVKATISMFSKYAKNPDINMISRIAFLRKYYEHNGIDNHKEAYDILSSLIHKRKEPKHKDGTKLTETDMQKGIKDIAEFINDFDYSSILNDYYDEDKIVGLYSSLKNNVEKVQAFRELLEIIGFNEVKEYTALIKFVNESYHIENDYAYYLDILNFDTIPSYIMRAIDEYMEDIKSNIDKYGDGNQCADVQI